ncbi:hypothetical protein SDC9_115648 [bioreactor metagenome]|uniref:Uncharacterized protein n=1 Tax=bioreactor metagenome TaxID=1076179 RepID=A0A645C434_9ZZZZ
MHGRGQVIQVAFFNGIQVDLADLGLTFHILQRQPKCLTLLAQVGADAAIHSKISRIGFDVGWGFGVPGWLGARDLAIYQIIFLDHLVGDLICQLLEAVLEVLFKIFQPIAQPFTAALDHLIQFLFEVDLNDFFGWAWLWSFRLSGFRCCCRLSIE